MPGLTQIPQGLWRQPFVVDVGAVGGSRLDLLANSLRALPLAVGAEELLPDDQQEHSDRREEHVEEESFAVESFVEFGDENGFVEDGFGERGAVGVAVVDGDVQAEGTSGEGFRREERVENGRLRVGSHLAVVGDGGEILDEVVEVHRVAERSFDRFNDEIVFAFVEEADEELNWDAAGQLQL